MPAEQDLKLKAQVEGADKAAADLGKIDAAQGKVVDKTKQATPATESLKDAQVELNAAEGDYISLLTQAHPQLGLMVDSMLKFAKITNEAGSAQLSLGAILNKTTTALKANAGVLKLVGAAGIAALAVWKLVEAYKGLAVEAEAANTALTAEAEATDKSRKAHEAAAKAVRDEANERQKLDKLLVEPSEAITRQAAGIARRFPAVDPTQAASLIGRFAGAGLEAEELETLVLAQAGKARVDPGVERGPEALRSFANVKLRETAVRDAARAAIKISGTLGRRRRSDLAIQAQAGGGAEVEGIVSQLTDDPETQERILGLIADVGGTTGGLEAQTRGVSLAERTGLGIFQGGPTRIESLVETHALTGAAAQRDVSASDFALLTAAIQNIDQTIKSQGPAVGYQIVNAPDAITQQGRTSTGQTIGEDRE
jgi:hypothetical protein